MPLFFLCISHLITFCQNVHNIGILQTLDVIMNFFILGDGKLEREHAEGDVELYLPGSLCCHVLHTGGEHQV